MALDVGALCVVLNFVFASVLLCFAVLLSCLKFIHYPILFAHVCVGKVHIQDFLL